MANDRTMTVKVIGDDASLQRAMARDAKAVDKFGTTAPTALGKIDRAFSRTQKIAAGGFIAGAAVTAGLRQANAAIQVASNLEEQISRNAVVFGVSAKAVEDWSKTTASSIGIAQDEALAAAGTFGAMFDQAGQNEADTARLSKAVVQLAADLGAFSNVPVADALTALRSGLSGEIEPLRKFQVFLTEAAVSERAMADSHKATVQELTQGEKIMARYNLILEQVGKQQGNFGATSDQLAGQQKILAAQTRDLQADLGTLLLPVMTQLVGGLADATTATMGLVEALKTLGGTQIPVIDIPVNFTIIDSPREGGKGFKVGDLLKSNIFDMTKILKDAVLGEGLFGPSVVTGGVDPAAAKAFDDNFQSFMEGLEKTATKSAKKAVNKFGAKGFKPVANELGASQEAAFKATMDALALKFDRAQLSKATGDDLGVLAEIEKAVRAQIAVRGRTTELLRMLFDVDQERASIAEDLADKQADAAKKAADRIEKAAKLRADRLERATKIQAEARERLQSILKAEAAKEQASQFRAIGLSGTGDAIIPGVGNLRKQFEQLSMSAVGQDVPKKLLDRLKLVGKALSGGIKNMKEPTREAINDLFATIRGEFDKQTKGGALTKTTSLNANKVLQGLGLGRDAEKELRARLSSFNSAGIGLAGMQRPTGLMGGAPVVVNITTTLDGQVVARNTAKWAQGTKRRNPIQKRGPNSAR